MEHIIWNGEVTYRLLHNGRFYHIPMSIPSEKAHKKLDRELRWKARKEQVVSWLEYHQGKVALIIFVVVALYWVKWYFNV